MKCSSFEFSTESFFELCGGAETLKSRVQTKGSWATWGCERFMNASEEAGVSSADQGPGAIKSIAFSGSFCHTMYTILDYNMMPLSTPSWFVVGAVCCDTVTGTNKQKPGFILFCPFLSHSFPHFALLCRDRKSSGPSRFVAFFLNPLDEWDYAVKRKVITSILSRAIETDWILR